MTVVDDEALVGHTLDGRYVIHARIARGGMGSVFRATDTRLDREVAVKIMHRRADLADDATARFVLEAKSAAKLNHRGIVSVYDQGTDGDLAYLVMEYVPGRTLRDVMRDEAPMRPRRALAYLEPVLMALSAAHDAGLVHRDVKPENVLIGPAGEVKVADFGLARAVSNDSTGGGTLVGTVSYLAPEVVTHQGSDARTDVYAVGAVLYEMLTGVKPHVADSPLAVAHKHVNEDVAKPSLREPGIPPYVDALVLRATARDAAQRSADARVLLHQVRQVQRALAAGLDDDPELTQDLLPGAGPTPANLPVITTGLDADREHTTVVATEAAERTEPTRSWHSPLPVAVDEAPPPVPPAPPKARRSRRGPILLVIALVLLALAAYGGWYLGVGRYTTAPDLVSMSRDEAVKTAEAAGFEVAFDAEQFSETVGKGAVLAADPGSGAKVLPGSTITLTISKGQERYKIPKIQGRTVEEAETILGALNLKVGKVTREYNEKIKEDGIIRSANFKVGDLVKRDTEVDLVVSKGPQPIKITDHTGATEAAATAALKKAGFEVSISRQYSDTVSAGTVVSQSPSSGTGYRGDRITLVVSQGPELVEVPHLEGMTEDQARAALQALGLSMNATKNPLAGDGATVRFQSPSAGTKKKRGETVTVFLT